MEILPLAALQHFDNLHTLTITHITDGLAVATTGTASSCDGGLGSVFVSVHFVGLGDVRV